MLDLPGNAHVLMLQGPVGPFFDRLTRDLIAHGHRVTRVLFNAGDSVFQRSGRRLAYRGHPDAWPEYIARLFETERVDALVLFGDCRYYHRIAHWTARTHDIPIYVFEEGYLRPDFITLELEGVNGHSQMPRDPAFYRAHQPEKVPTPEQVGSPFLNSAVFSMLYYLAMNLGWLAYPFYQHHRPWFVPRESFCWVRSGWRKLFSKRRDAEVEELLQTRYRGNYFLVPLQMNIDAQVRFHSKFGSVEEFVLRVIQSFAQHASTDAVLVFKHHPLDRGYSDYRRFIEASAESMHVVGRVFYVHDLHLPALLKNARGTVVINSTVGLSSLYHDTPVKVLGDAIYDIAGITSRQPLDAFWRAPEPVDEALFTQFRNWMMAHNQANGSFYRRLPGTRNAVGVHWFPMHEDPRPRLPQLPRRVVVAADIGLDPVLPEGALERPVAVATTEKPAAPSSRVH
jgi:capsule polysaccharide modification protein KpsS